jgi:hypothetical protein
MRPFADRPPGASLPPDTGERAARGVAALRELRRIGASGPTGRARPGAGLERGEILRGRALAGLVIAPGSRPASRLGVGLGGLGAIDEAYRSFVLASIEGAIRAVLQPPADLPGGLGTADEARLARVAAPGETITTVLRVANRSYGALAASPRVTRWYDLESGSPVDGFETVFGGERRFEPRSDALWRVSVRTPSVADGVCTCVGAITFGRAIVPSIRMEVRLEAARQRRGPGEPSHS